MTDKVSMTLTIDASQANRALDETRKRAENLGGAKESLSKQLTGMKEKLEITQVCCSVVSRKKISVVVW